MQVDKITPYSYHILDAGRAETLTMKSGNI
jgi:hypothetical protein